LRSGAPAYQPELFDHFTEVSVVHDDLITRFSLAVESVLKRPGQTPGTVTVPDMALRIIAHIQNTGDVDAHNTEWIGRRGSGRWIEGISITPAGTLPPDAIAYSVVQADGSVSPWTAGGDYAGTRGVGQPIVGLSIQLSAEATRDYDCTCEATFTDGSVCGPVPARTICRGLGHAPLEAFRVVLKRRGP
jgi:hypothetical protein